MIPTQQKEATKRKCWMQDDTIGHSLGRSTDLLPKISIVTPSYNQGQFIEQTILSVINQGYPNIEYVIIDGGSTDQTINIIKKYEQHIHYWVSEPDEGQTNALNKGFAKCTGDVMAYLNSDDFYAEGTFNKVSEYFRYPDVNIINGACAWFWEGEDHINFQKSRYVTYDRLLKYWIGDVIPAQPSVFFRKNVLEKAGLPDESLVYGMDVDMWIKMSKYYDFTQVNEVLSYYRFHNNSKTGGPGLFKKFRPEWYRLSQRELQTKSLTYKISYYLSRYFYLFRVWFYELRKSIRAYTGMSIGRVAKNNGNSSFLSWINKKL